MVTVGLLAMGGFFLTWSFSGPAVGSWSLGSLKSPVSPPAHYHGQFWLSLLLPDPHLPPPSFQPRCPALLCFLHPEASWDSPTNTLGQAHPPEQ